MLALSWQQSLHHSAIRFWSRLKKPANPTIWAVSFSRNLLCKILALAVIECVILTSHPLRLRWRHHCELGDSELLQFDSETKRDSYSGGR
jgi:hypothetical protein